MTTHTFTKSYVDGNQFVAQDLVFKQKGQVMLRSGFTAERSNIVLNKMVRLLCVDAIFRDCQIISHAIRGSNAARAQFIDCTFHGTFIDWKFGGRGVSPAVVGCDFTDAELSDCDFQSCNVREQAFAGWPTVVFERPFEHRAALRAATWPRTAKAMAWVQSLTAIECDGVVIHGERAARWMGVKPKALREAVEAIESEAIVKLI